MIAPAVRLLAELFVDAYREACRTLGRVAALLVDEVQALRLLYVAAKDRDACAALRLAA